MPVNSATRVIYLWPTHYLAWKVSRGVIIRASMVHFSTRRALISAFRRTELRTIKAASRAYYRTRRQERNSCHDSPASRQHHAFSCELGAATSININKSFLSCICTISLTSAECRAPRRLRARYIRECRYETIPTALTIFPV